MMLERIDDLSAKLQEPGFRPRELWALALVFSGLSFAGYLALKLFGARRGWGLAGDLTIPLGTARIVSRGPKATGALRAAGLPEEWSPESESSPPHAPK